LAVTLMLVTASSTPLSADPSQRNMDAVQAAVREMRDQLQARMCKSWYWYRRNINDPRSTALAVKPAFGAPKCGVRP
jgi:hypothetical protein